MDKMHSAVQAIIHPTTLHTTMIDAKRSILGTIFVAILVLLHCLNVWDLVSFLWKDWSMYTFWDLLPDLLQVIVWIIYISLLAFPVKSRWVRFVLAFIIACSFTFNVVSLYLEWGMADWYSLGRMILVFADVPIMLALCTHITSGINKIMPFYGIETTEF